MQFGQTLGVIALLISLYILWQIRQVLLLVLLAIVFATALNRVVRRWKQSGARRSFATVLAVVSLLTAAVLFGWLIVPPFIHQLNLLAELVPIGLDRVRSWLVMMQDQLSGSILADLPRIDTVLQQARPFATWAMSNFFALFSNFLSIFLSLLLVLVLTIMFLINPKPYRRGLIALFPAFYRRRIDEILTECESSLVGWIRGILIDMAVISIVSGLGLWALQVPLPLANAALAGLLEAIPNLGPTLSLIPPMAIALLDEPWKAGAVLVLYIIIQQLEQYLLVPVVMASQVSLLPAVTLLSQVVFAIFFGFLGLLLAIPLIIVGQIWIQEVLVKDILDPWQHPSRSLPASPDSDGAAAEETQSTSL